MTLKRGSVLDYALIFLAGASWDAILSVDTIFTAHFSWLAAFVSTVSVTLLSYLMYDRIVEELKINWSKVFTLALGSGIGASLSTYILKTIYQ